MKQKFITIFIGIIFQFLFPLNSFSDLIVEGYHNDWGPFGSNQHFEVKNGGNSWEAAKKNGQTVLDNFNFIVNSNAVYEFSLSHYSTSGDIIFDIGGNSLIWETGYNSVDQIHVLVKGNSLENYKSTAIIKSITTPNIQQNPNKIISGGLVGMKFYNDSSSISDFTFTGTWSPRWTGDSSLDAGAEMFIGWTGGHEAQVPIPGAVWLLGSGLFGLIGFKRKNFFKKS